MKDGAREGAASAAAAQPKGGKKSKTNLNFSELDDIFLSNKGKKQRNLQKKLDKIKEQEKLVRKGEIQANADMEQKFASKATLQAEIKELQELIDLYIQANPDYAKKSGPQITEEDVQRAVKDALSQVASTVRLANLVEEGQGFVEASDEQRASLAAVASSLKEKASDSFEAGSGSSFVTNFAALAAKSDDSVCDGGVSYKELAEFVASAESSERSKIVQRIADSKIVAQPEPETAEPVQEEQAKETAPAEEKPEQTEAVVSEPVVEASAAAEETKGEEKTATPATTEDAGFIEGQRRGRGGRGRGDRDRRGGRGGRGGHNRDPEDDFETAGQPQQRRGGYQRRGRGDRDYRGDRGGRGDRRGGFDRAERGDRGNRGRGERPPTAQPAASEAPATTQQ